MKAKKFVPLMILVLVLILELLPYGAVLNFANPNGEPTRVTFSYFSFIPYGYANFGPLITAILTCVMLVLSLVYLLKPMDGIKFVCKVISILAVVASLAPLMFGVSVYSVIGGAISALLIAECIVLRKMV